MHKACSVSSSWRSNLTSGKLKETFISGEMRRDWMEHKKPLKWIFLGFYVNVVRDERTGYIAPFLFFSTFISKKCLCLISRVLFSQFPFCLKITEQPSESLISSSSQKRESSSVAEWAVIIFDENFSSLRNFLQFSLLHL